MFHGWSIQVGKTSSLPENDKSEKYFNICNFLCAILHIWVTMRTKKIEWNNTKAELIADKHS